MALKKNKPEETKEANPQETTTAEQTKETGEATYVLTQTEMDELKGHIDGLKKQLEETVTLLQRNQADFDNFRKRNASVRADSYEEGKRESIAKLLPILDDFDRMNEQELHDEAWAEGVKLVHRKLMETLAKEGLTEVEADGAFDPNLHNAVMMEAVEGVESGQVVAVFQKGYRVKDKIIRHSMVKVSQ